MPRILVADDNAVSLRFLAEALKARELDCATAVDGTQAAALAEALPFDLLLLDARMPRLDGPGALARIRGGNGPSARAAALATTAGDAASHAVLIAAGFAAVLPKPLALDVLYAALAHHLGGDRERLLDDAGALAVGGGDPAIVDALRGLLRVELAALPGELRTMAARADRAGLRERLHRLDASAGFCGALALARASAALRATLDVGGREADTALERLIDAATRTARVLERASVREA